MTYNKTKQLFRTAARTTLAASLVASSAPVSAVTITLAWTGCPQATSYEVCSGGNSRFQVTAPGGYSYCLDTGIASQATVTPYNATGMSVFAVRAVRGAEKSAFSNEAAIKCTATTCAQPDPVRMKILKDSVAPTTYAFVTEDALGVPLVANDQVTAAIPTGYAPILNTPHELSPLDKTFRVLSLNGDLAGNRLNMQPLDITGRTTGVVTTLSFAVPYKIVTADRNPNTGYGSALLQNTTTNAITALPFSPDGKRTYSTSKTVASPATGITWLAIQVRNDGSQIVYGRDVTERIGYVLKLEGTAGSVVPPLQPVLSYVSVVNLDTFGYPADYKLMKSLAANLDGTAVRLVAKSTTSAFDVLDLDPQSLVRVAATPAGPFVGVAPQSVVRGSNGKAQIIFTYGVGGGYPQGTVATWTLDSMSLKTSSLRFVPVPMTLVPLSMRDSEQGLSKALAQGGTSGPRKPKSGKGTMVAFAPQV